MDRKKLNVSSTKFRFPRKVAVFPLPNVLLFPKVELPLYIFEPRYRQMLKDVMSSNKFMAVSLLKKGWQKDKEPYPSHEIVSVGYVKAAVSNSDGTSHILLKGLRRVQIIRYTQMEPYRTALVRHVPDKVGNRKQLNALIPKLSRLFRQKLSYASEKPTDKIALPPELERDPIALSHFVSFTANADPYLKQTLLETVNASRRVKHLISILQNELCPSSLLN